MAGAALIRDRKLLSWVDQEWLSTYYWITGGKEIITLQNVGAQHYDITLEVRKEKYKWKLSTSAKSDCACTMSPARPSVASKLVRRRRTCCFIKYYCSFALQLPFVMAAGIERNSINLPLLRLLPLIMRMENIS